MQQYCNLESKNQYNSTRTRPFYLFDASKASALLCTRAVRCSEMAQARRFLPLRSDYSPQHERSEVSSDVSSKVRCIHLGKRTCFQCHGAYRIWNRFALQGITVFLNQICSNLSFFESTFGYTVIFQKLRQTMTLRKHPQRRTGILVNKQITILCT